jgi:hypothetical protein
MPNDEYMRALDKALTDLEDRVHKRDILNAEIAGLKETVRVLSSRVPLNKESESRIVHLLALVEYATPNLKDSIRTALIRAGEPLTAVEVRNALEETGFNFDDFSNPLSACHATLKRMATDGEVATGTKDGKTAYYIELKLAGGIRATIAGLAGPVDIAGPFDPLEGLGTPIAPRTRGRSLTATRSGEFKAEESRGDRFLRIARQKREELKNK